MSPRRLAVAHARRAAEVIDAARVGPGDPPAAARARLAERREALGIRAGLAHVQEAAARVVLDEHVLRHSGRRPHPEPERRARALARRPDRQPIRVEARLGRAAVEYQACGEDAGVAAIEE